MYFRYVTVVKTTDNRFRVEWDIYSNPPSNPVSVDDCNFEIQMSNSPASEFIALGTVDGAIANYYIPSLTEYDINQTYYFKVKAINKIDITNTATSGFAFTSSKYNGDMATMKYAEDILYHGYSGVPYLVLIRKTTGARCNVCWSTMRQQRIKSSCDVCHGSGFITGYYQPIAIQIADDGEEVQSISKETGEDITDYKAARMSNYPLLKPKDIIISQDTDQHYEVITVDITKLPNLSSDKTHLAGNNYVLSQMLSLREINANDPEYFSSIGTIIYPTENA